MNDAASSIGTMWRKGIHPAAKKVARKVVKKAAKQVGRSLGSGVAEELGYGALQDFSAWYTNRAIDRAFGG